MNFTKRLKSFIYEADPKRRKTVSINLKKRCKRLLNEYQVRTGHQAVFITFNKFNKLKVFGAEPLKSAIEVYAPIITEACSTAETSLPPQNPPIDNQILPDLIIDDVQKTIDELLQADLRYFIPLMMKYATGRGMPGWGKPEMKPEWWPDATVPWASIRVDTRTNQQKREKSWKLAMKEIVLSCYRYFNEEHLLYVGNVVKPEIIVPVVQFNTDPTNGVPAPYFTIPPVDETSNNPKPMYDLTDVVNYCRENSFNKIIMQTEDGDVVMDVLLE